MNPRSRLLAFSFIFNRLAVDLGWAAEGRTPLRPPYHIPSSQENAHAA
jgi:hypothetical protein